jgi:formylglycine-generating enzyme
MIMSFLPLFVTLTLALSPPSSGGGRAQPVDTNVGMARVPAGSYLPHYSRDRSQVRVESFEIDRHPVTRGDYLEFVKARPAWRKGQAKPIFVGRAYLSDWAGELDPGTNRIRQPVTFVSWFAARSYCEWQGKRLPTTDEWEYVAQASETKGNATGESAHLQRLIEMATALRPGRDIGSGFRNVHGVSDMHGLVSEWVLDFNNVSVSDDSRGAGGEHDRLLYCAAGGMAATNPSNYAAFLRYATRAALDGSSTLGSLGFRCARSIG